MRSTLCLGRSLASKALYDYLDSGTMPSLPANFTDQAGRLMANVQYVIQELDQVISSLQESATVDHLTGAYNRRAGEQRLASDLARVGRGEGSLTLAVVDLDRLKPINDRCGHQAGDICLRHLAETCIRNVREGDWLARWGGDEFVLALWEESVFASPEAVLGRINADLRRSPVRLPGGRDIVLSISVGAHRYAGEEDLRELLAKADAAM